MNKEVKQALNSTLTRVHTSLMARSLRGMYVCYGQSVTIASDLHIWTGGVGVVLREQIFYDGKFWRRGVGGGCWLLSPPPQLQTQRQFVHKFYFPVLANWNQIGT